MENQYDYSVSRPNQTINLCIIAIGDLVWWGSIFNIGKLEFIGIIIDTEYDFSYNQSLYKIYTNNGIINTQTVFPMESLGESKTRSYNHCF